MTEEKKKTITDYINDYSTKAPIEIDSLAKAVGLNVLLIDFEKLKIKLKNSFLLYYDEKAKENIVFINKQDDLIKNRFAIAIGISFLQSSYNYKLKTGVLYQWDNERICSASLLSESENNEIRRSALELIMPSNLFYQEILKFEDTMDTEKIISSLMDVFKVSKQMIITRIRLLVDEKKS